MEAQLQIRQNVQDAQAAVADLLRWQQAQKLKDAQRNSQRLDPGKPAEALPPVRSTNAPTPPVARDSGAPPTAQASIGSVRAVNTKQCGQKDVSPAAHTYDHFRDKWDRFDVDAALAEASGSDEEAMQAPVPQAPLLESPTVKQQSAQGTNSASSTERAEALKVQGNASFQAGQYARAREQYTASISAAPTCLAFANRAMVSLKLHDFGAAEADCTQALSLDPSYVKALQRRATARKHRKNYLGAAEDVEQALRYQPASKVLAEERWACLALLQSAEGLQPLAKRTRVQLAAGLAMQRHGAYAQAAVQPVAPVGVQQHATAASSCQAAAPVRPDAHNGSPVAANPSAVISPAASTDVAGPGLGVASSSTQASPTAAESSRGKQLERKQQQLVNGQCMSPQRTPPHQQKPLIASPVPVAATAPRPTALSPPRTGTEFETNWRGLQGQPQAAAQYLGLLEPNRLPELFKHSLTGPTLRGILAVALEQLTAQDAAFAAELLHSLALVPRFAMLLMCLPRREKAALRASWDAAAETGGPQLADVRKLYNGL